MNFQSKFEESLKQLDLQGIILIQGLLAQRALELIMAEKEAKTPAILKPEAKIVL